MSTDQFPDRAGRPPAGHRRPPVARSRAGRGDLAPPEAASLATPPLDRPPLGHAPGEDDLLWVAARPVDVRGRLVVEVVGEVDHYTAPLLASCLRGQTGRRGLRELVVDVRRVTFLGGVGLRHLVEARQRCALRGVRLVLRCDGRGAVLHPLELAGLTGLLGVQAPDRSSGRTASPPARRVPRKPPRRQQPAAFPPGEAGRPAVARR